MSEPTDWKCAGCGIPTPMRVERCNCPTGCVFSPTAHKSAVKYDRTIGLLSIAYVANRASDAGTELAQ